MLRIKWLVVAAACGSLSAGVALGASHSSETMPVTADYQLSTVSEKVRACDAHHQEVRIRFEGSQTSSDPRLAGSVEIRVRSVVNTSNGYGRDAGKSVLRDQATGKVKLRARFVGVVEPHGDEGFIIGRTTGPASVRLLANYNAQRDPTTGDLVGELGQDSQTGQPQDPGVFTNACDRQRKRPRGA
jgi:hypothetical protein